MAKKIEESVEYHGKGEECLQGKERVGSVREITEMEDCMHIELNSSHSSREIET